MASRWWKWLLVVIAVPLLVWGCDRLWVIYWVGSTDLDVEFVVTEAGSGRSVPEARVEVISEGGFYADEKRDEAPFTLRTDATGAAGRVCHHSMCFGTMSGLGFTNTYVVHLPFWRFRVTAPDYEPSEWVDLDVPEYIRQVRRTGPEQAKLVVPVSLQKSQP